MTTNPGDPRKPAVLAELQQLWQAWQLGRIQALLLAGAAVDEGVASLTEVLAAMGNMPVANYYRHRKALRPAPGSALEAAVVAEVDRALRAAGADESTTLDDVKNNPDLELALARVGVHHRGDDTNPEAVQ